MIVHDAQNGEIKDGPIRYLMLRADVLMGTLSELAPDQSIAWLQAMERSAFLRARDSFQQYRSSGRFGADDFLVRSAEVAATLGWGKWTVTDLGGGRRLIHVRNSPFAAGHGPASRPVCATICGVLKAIALVGYGQDAEIREQTCAAQGLSDECLFELSARV